MGESAGCLRRVREIRRESESEEGERLTDSERVRGSQRE